MPEGFCEQCNGKCCTEFTVYITHADIKRLVDHTGRDPTTFVTAYADDQKATYPIIRMGGYDVRLGLTYRDKKCTLLHVENDNRRRCTVQDHKPMVCRTYPFSVSDDGKLVHVEPYKCPGPIWPSTEQERAKAISEVRQLHREYNEYEAIVNAWNRLPEGKRTDLSSFIRFSFSHNKR